MNTMLPTSDEESEVIHQRFRAIFCTALAQLQVASRPWIWGGGDADPPMPTGSASSAQVAARTSSHQCVSVDQRLDLLREHGTHWGDDEIRFHIQNMLLHKDCVLNNPDTAIPGFTVLDPLVSFTWHSVGKAMCESWCRVNPQVSERGFHIISALLIDHHWTPVWIVPHGHTMVAHLFRDGIADAFDFHPLMETLKTQFGFCEYVLHWSPQRLPEHTMCGAEAIAFLGHIVVGSPLPDSLQELRLDLSKHFLKIGVAGVPLLGEQG